MHLSHKPHEKRGVGAKRYSPLFSVTTTSSSTTKPTVKSLHQCGRWSLRCTKSRQDRVCNKRKRKRKRKRSLESAGHSSSGENELPSTAKQTAKEHPKARRFEENVDSTRKSKSSKELPDSGASSEAFPIRECLSILEGLEGINPDQCNKALVMFKDVQWREIFIFMPSHRKIYWVNKLP